MDKPYFPMFVDLSDKEILIVGGGKIALRRIKALLRFASDITVIAPEVEKEVKELADDRKIHLLMRGFCSQDIIEPEGKNWDIVLAATNQHELNENIVTLCRKQRIPVNTADRKEACDFYFPGLVEVDGVIFGISSGGKNPEKVRRAREIIEEKIKKIY